MEEAEIKKIEEETKKLLDKFSLALSSVQNVESNVIRECDRRKEGQGKALDETFRRIMFENAPQKDDDFLYAEKKTW